MNNQLKRRAYRYAGYTLFKYLKKKKIKTLSLLDDSEDKEHLSNFEQIKTCKPPRPFDDYFNFCYRIWVFGLLAELMVGLYRDDDILKRKYSVKFTIRLDHAYKHNIILHTFTEVERRVEFYSIEIMYLAECLMDRKTLTAKEIKKIIKEAKKEKKEYFE